MASSKLSNDDRYSVRNPSRGLLVIISNENFEGSPNLKRSGTEVDVERLTKTFGQLGFEEHIHTDQSCVQMLQIMDDVADLNLEPYDCLAVVILTHGSDDDEVYGVGKGNDISSLFTILNPLKKISRAIPKLVFVQACRGENLDKGRQVQADSGSGGNGIKYIRVPLESDFLYHFSTSPGYFSFRNATDGSIFIKSLCDVFDEYIKKDEEIDLLKSLVKVNRRVADGYTSHVPRNIAYHDMKQMPSFMCMLRKDVILKKQA